MRATRIAVVALIVSFGAAITAPIAASADVSDFTFTSFDADYYLSRAADGSSRLKTVETLVADFPEFNQNKGIIRAIATTLDTVSTNVNVISVTDENGTPVPYESSDGDDDFLELALGTDQYVLGPHTYVITYEQSNVTGNFANTNADEFYWDTNGIGWAQPFGSVTARVHVPAELKTALTGNAACYQGSEDSTTRCAITEEDEDGGSVFTSSVSNLGPYQNVTVAIGFNDGTFTEPAAARDAAWVAIAPLLLIGLALALLIWVILLRATRWRDSRGRGTIIAEYSVPKNMNLLQAANLIGREKDAISAQLMSFAVRKLIRIIDLTEPGKPLFSMEQPFEIEFLTATGADQQEIRLLQILFGKDLKVGKTRSIGASEEQVGVALRAELTGLTSASIKAGWRRRAPKGETRPPRLLAILLTVATVALFVIFAGIEAGAAAGLTFVAILPLIVVFVLLRVHPLLTDEGAVQRDYLRGIEVYLKLAEAERFKMLQSPEGAERERVDVSDPRQVVKVYEKLLPFAVLWNVEKEWADELERLYATNGITSDWYTGSTPFNSYGFAALVGTFNAQAVAAPAPPPSTWSGSGGSSSFGGSMGGGFSGGGGGGGGGGGR